MILRCLIVDDEPLAREVLREDLLQLPDVEIVGEAGNTKEALKVLQHQLIDVIFLDIQMPGINGLEFAKSLPHPPALVFITAYPEFAVEGFALEAIDYLVKPFRFARLAEAVTRVRTRLTSAGAGPQNFITLKADKRLHKIAFEELFHLEATGDFVKVHHQGRTLIVSDTLKSLQGRLPSPPFCRIHKSHLINLDHLEYMEGNYVSVMGKSIPIGAIYRDELKGFLQA